jgi:hypothetical protein
MTKNFSELLVTATGGAASRSFGDYLADVNNAKNKGAKGDGATDDKAAIDAAAVNGAVFLPVGVFRYGTDDNGGGLAGKRFEGPGVVKTGANKQFRYFGFLDAPPAANPSSGGNGSILTAGNGDWSKTILPIGFRVQGSSTLGNPTTGYLQRYETAPVVMFGRVGATAGQNYATNWTDGRTGWSFQHMKIDHHGQGDATAITVGVDIWSNKADATHFLAQPAGNIFGGGVTAWVDHVNAVLGEFYVNGRDKDINGSGFALHFIRNVDTGAQEALWRALSIISSGSKPIDAVLTMRGKIHRGVSTSLADLGTTQAAIDMAVEQRIYFNSTKKDSISSHPGASGYKQWDQFGDAWMAYSVVGGLNSFTFSKPINVQSGQVYKVNGAQVVAARDTGWTAMTGTANKSASYDVSSVTLPQLAARVAALQATFTTHGLIGA